MIVKPPAMPALVVVFMKILAIVAVVVSLAIAVLPQAVIFPRTASALLAVPVLPAR